jgi:hypothetical protein
MFVAAKRRVIPAEAGIQSKGPLEFLDAPVSGTGQDYRVRHDGPCGPSKVAVDFNQPHLSPSSYRRGQSSVEAWAI